MSGIYHSLILCQLSQQGSPWEGCLREKPTTHLNFLVNTEQHLGEIHRKWMGVKYIKNVWEIRMGESFQFGIIIFQVFNYRCIEFGASLVARRVKRLPAMWETWVRSLGWEDPLEKGMATHSSILAWRMPWTEEPGRLQSTRSQRVRHKWATSLSFLSSFFQYRIWRLKRGRKLVGGLSGSMLETRYLTSVATWIANTLFKSCGYNLSFLIFLFKK